MANYQDLFQDVGGAASDLFSAFGSGIASKSETAAGNAELMNVKFEKENVALQEFQAQRKIEQGVGREAAGVAGAGFAASGSALDLMRSSVEEGALQKASIGIEGAIQENSYQMQANADFAQASAASNAQTGGFFGSILKGVGAIASLF